MHIPHDWPGPSHKSKKGIADVRGEGSLVGLSSSASGCVCQAVPLGVGRCILLAGCLRTPELAPPSLSHGDGDGGQGVPGRAKAGCQQEGRCPLALSPLAAAYVAVLTRGWCG